MKISTIIIFYITILISSFVMLKIYSKFSNKKMPYNKKNILTIFFACIIIFINNIFVPVKIRGFSADILFILLIKIVFKDKLKTNLYYALIILVMLQVFDLLTAFFLPLSIKNVEVLNQSVYFKVLITIVVNFLLYLTLANRYVVQLVNQFKNTNKNSKIFYILSCFALILFTIWTIYSSSNTDDKTLNIILCVTEITIFIMLILSLKNNYEKSISKIKEEQLKQNLDLYSKVASEYKELRHNLMNDLLIIKTKIKKNDQEFINEIINKYKSNYEWVNCITDIPEGLQGLVFLKKHQAELKNITFNLEYNVNKKVENLFSINKNFKLYESLGILFDNAIEGAAESNEKMINVVFFYDKKALKINILNTFNNEIDLDKIGNKNYSTKKRGSGIGLNYIKNQTRKFKINQNIRNNIFITEIIINTK